MRIKAKKSVEQIDEMRKRDYLMEWPVHKQLEAYHDNALGKPEKLARMTADFQAIKAKYPK